MNLQELVRLHKELSKKIEELEAQRKELGLAILQQMSATVINLPGFVVRRCNRLSIKLTIEEARALNAIKIEETVDKDKIKALHKNGHLMTGVSEIQYVQITSSTKQTGD